LKDQLNLSASIIYKWNWDRRDQGNKRDLSEFDTKPEKEVTRGKSQDLFKVVKTIR
jgi:hypothetical protein